MSNTRAVSENNRAYIRLKLNSEVALQAASGGDEHLGHCVDMSGSGLMISTDAPFQKGEKVIARIKSKGSEIVYHTTVVREVAEESSRKIALAIDEILD